MPPKKEPDQEQDPLKTLFRLFADNRYMSKSTTGVFRSVLLYFLFDQWRIIQLVPEMSKRIGINEGINREQDKELEKLKSIMRQNGWQVGVKKLLGDAPIPE